MIALVLQLTMDDFRYVINSNTTQFLEISQDSSFASRSNRFAHLLPYPSLLFLLFIKTATLINKTICKLI
jgi:hypothetical protein